MSQFLSRACIYLRNTFTNESEYMTLNRQSSLAACRQINDVNLFSRCFTQSQVFLLFNMAGYTCPLAFHAIYCRKFQKNARILCEFFFRHRHLVCPIGKHWWLDTLPLIECVIYEWQLGGVNPIFQSNLVSPIKIRHYFSNLWNWWKVMLLI